MAYISTEEVARIRKEVKVAFPKYKFSISRHHYTEVVVSLMKADFQVEEGYTQINHHHLEHYNQEIKNVFDTILDIINGVKVNYDSNAGDLGADYPNFNYFISFCVGKWDKHYQQI